MKYRLTSENENSNITVFLNGEILVADQKHPNFAKIVEGAVAQDESIADLFDIGAAVAKKFESLGERTAFANGRIYFDGDEVDNALTKQVLRFVEAGVEDYKPLVNFFEKMAGNPNQHSREQAYTWLDRHGFTIHEDGDVIMYKGVRRDGEGVLRSISAGPGIVNGQETTGNLDNSVGNVLEMARSNVQHNPEVGCASGLHGGTWAYASTFGPVTLAIKVNPRDIVSVPTDCDAQKVRCSKYTVLEIVTERSESPVWAGSLEDYDDEDVVYCECCEDEIDWNDSYGSLCQDCLRNCN